jgi:hypothetical protein
MKLKELLEVMPTMLIDVRCVEKTKAVDVFVGYTDDFEKDQKNNYLSYKVSSLSIYDKNEMIICVKKGGE